MQKKFYPILLVSALVLLSGTVVLAQKPTKPGAPPGTNYKKPLVKCYLGKATGNTTMKADEAKQIISLPLMITDDKNVNYVISSYQFAYSRTGLTEDEETGKTSAQSDMAADRFTTTPLPAVWQKNIIEGLHKGEELYFFDIIVFDKQGRRFFAPELKISIQ
ncbi:MAG: hypothetical protein ABI760_01865 [Ferruginibacter sp.]